MRPPQQPAASCPAKTAIRNKKNATRGARRRHGNTRYALPALLLLAAVSAAAVLPGSLAAPAKKLVLSNALAPSVARTSEAAPAAPTSRAALFAPAPLFQAAPGPLTLQTFAADCTTPKSDWNLGEVVCAKVSGVTSASLVQLVNPSGYAVIRTEVGVGASSVSFTIPADETIDVDTDTFDNRGTWRVALVSAIDLGTRLAVPITVHDPNDTVANLQVVKTLADTQATAGANIRALVRVYNAGPDAAANVEFTDTPPANTTFQSLQQTGGPTFACTTPAVDTTGPSVCTIASLARDTAADFVVTYKVNGNIPNATDLSTTATAETTTTETASADNGSGDSATSDNPSPPNCTLACPSNITVDSDPGLAGANVNYPDTTASSGCGTLTTSHPEDEQTGTAFFPIGSTTVTITGGDGSSCSFVVTVIDKRAVTITLNGPAQMTVECTTGFSDPGATASDGTSSVPVTTTVSVPNGQVDGNGDPIYVTVPAVNVNAPGDYTITYTATKDSATATATRIVHVVDTTAPVITLAGTAGYGTETVTHTDTDENGNPIVVTETIPATTVECHTSFTAPTATAADGCDTAPIAVTVAGAVDVNTVGIYDLVYGAVDASGNDTERRVRVRVVDTTKPVITINGANPMLVFLNTTFTDPGATATDGCAGSVPVSASGSVNTAVVGLYTITYTATDPSGNTQTATRTVQVGFNFTGFFSPVNNLPTINQMNAGRAIPVKFSLDGYQGMGIMAANSPYSQQVNCSTSAPIADVEATETSGGSTLTYDSGSDQYHYNWKTEKSWAGTCRVLTVKLIDNTEHNAYFKFK
ncbi:MAG TPA: PxKF domain-containing protein [Pyrinomonadaceae bacterium]